jgi:membrane protein implicated in regulation of membrane protease activity
MHAGERWTATWTGELVDGTEVRIDKVDGLMLEVSPHESPD